MKDLIIALNDDPFLLTIFVVLGLLLLIIKGIFSFTFFDNKAVLKNTDKLLAGQTGLAKDLADIKVEVRVSHAHFSAERAKEVKRKLKEDE